VKRLEGEFFGGQPQKAMAPFLADLANIRFAWEWAVEHHNAEIFNDMADTFMQAFDFAGLYRDAYDLAQQATASLLLLADPITEDVTLAKGRVMGLAGAFLFRLGEYKQSLDWCQQSMQTLEEVRPHIAYAHSFVYAGAAEFGLGDMENVVTYWQKAAKEYQAANSEWGFMTANSNLAEVFNALGRYEEGKSSAEHALTLARKMHNLESIGSASTSLAFLALQDGKYSEATQFAEEALRSHQQVGHDAHIANSLAVLAQIASKQNNPDEARRLLEESIGILQRVGNRLYLEQRTQELNEVLTAQNK
jgi:tetratricopeptide (TPR) repeat protein